VSDALVTGASSGVGAALARALVTRGQRVAGVARRADLLETLRKELPAGRFVPVACDVSVTDDVGRAIARLDAEGFAPDLVILNAGINLPDLEPGFRLAAAEQVFRVNVFGALAWVERLLPRMLAARRGHFVAISSMSAFRTSGRSVAYAASKASLSMAFESLRFRYAAEPLRFTTVHLGPVDTAMWPGGKFPFLLTPDEAARRILRAVERGRAVYDCPGPVVAAARLSALIPGWALTKLERLARSATKKPAAVEDRPKHLPNGSEAR